MGDRKAKYPSVAEMVRGVSEDQRFADDFDRRVNSRRLVKHLFALRNAAGMSQKDIADRIGCSQSRISKLESGNDNDLRLADLAAYLRALGLDLCLVFGQKDSTLVNKIKYHALAIKRLFAELVKLAQMDERIAEGVAGFHGEAFFNLIEILRDSAKKLPRREDGTAFVDIEIETARIVADHLAELDDSETSEGALVSRAELTAAQ
jgi:transcriptional regulator with XRE-family HTH domain